MTKRAICMGINNYPGSDNDLEGCVNDANDWRNALEKRGFAVTSMLDSEATKSKMVEALTKIVRDTGKNDICVITYSGHGTWVPDLDDDDDEPDGRDEAICPHDAMEGELLVDDELHGIFSERAYGARVIMISDSCHSGSVSRMCPAMTNVRTVFKTVPRIRFLDNRLIFKDARLLNAVSRAQRLPRSRRVSASALLLAGCRDDEYSYDAYFNDRANGAFTFVALQALAGLSAKATYKTWMSTIKESLPNVNYPQTPTLSAAAYQRKWQVLAE